MSLPRSRPLRGGTASRSMLLATDTPAVGETIVSALAHRNSRLDSGNGILNEDHTAVHSSSTTATIVGSRAIVSESANVLSKSLKKAATDLTDAVTVPVACPAIMACG